MYYNPSSFVWLCKNVILCQQVYRSLKISLGFSTLTTRFVDVSLTHSVAYGKYSAVFIDREEAKAYAVKKLSSVIITASEHLSNIVNDNICISDVIDIQEGKNFILKA